MKSAQPRRADSKNAIRIPRESNDDKSRFLSPRDAHVRPQERAVAAARNCVVLAPTTKLVFTNVR